MHWGISRSHSQCVAWHHTAEAFLARKGACTPPVYVAGLASVDAAGGGESRPERVMARSHSSRRAKGHIVSRDTFPFRDEAWQGSPKWRRANPSLKRLGGRWNAYPTLGEAVAGQVCLDGPSFT